MEANEYIQEMSSLFGSKNSREYFIHEGLLDVKVAMEDDKILKKSIHSYGGEQKVYDEICRRLYDLSIL